MFASDRQIQLYKPSRVCDLVSLMYVVYYFVEHGLPWTDYIDLIMIKDRSKNLYNPQNFKELRLKYSGDFQAEFENWISPFGDIFKYLYAVISGKSNLKLDYEKILAFLPDSLTMSNVQIEAAHSFQLGADPAMQVI